MPNADQKLISQVVARIPEWIRHELAAKNSSHRERAEEALTAMIAAAMASRDGTLPADPS